MTKRKKQYFPPNTSNRRAPTTGSDVTPERPSLATINLEAAAGRPGFKVGDRVRIGGSGAYAGETGVIERLANGVIPSAVTRLANGTLRHVRTIDLSHAED